MSIQVVVAKLAGLTGRSAELRQLLADRARAVRDEDGCLGYEVAERLDEPASFVIVQTWASNDALRAHFSTSAHADYQHAGRRAALHAVRGGHARGGVDHPPEREHLADGPRALRLASRPPRA
ncbi:antibiotic biosynthesis monooxygenase family protein [Solirubrobacter soli]|uniref:antibiotic biosynthesis monooxygenase family protein n=1 Tax=Solirubrobacter soli TaxID=363832 RepID=UPI00041227AC|nr:antibiotic biosynthesis monooxygenase family protein [Solirubrobacter soli]